jgi:transposase
MVLYVRDLERQEKDKLRSWLISGEDAMRHRAQLILLSAKGYRIPEIGEILNAHPANLRKWVHRFNENGCQGLITVHSGGAKPRISREQKERIVKLAEKPPRELGLEYTSWTLNKLADEAENRDIVDRISHEYVRQILLKADCSYKHAEQESVTQSG